MSFRFQWRREVKKKNNDQGESLAAIFLWNEAHKLLTALDDMAHKRPELFRVIARQTFYWPGFISHKRAFDRKNAELMEKIELGVDCPYSPKQWQISAPTTQLAMTFHLYCRTYEKQWQLPPLTTKKNKRLWFERAWQYMADDLHVVPENDPVLAPLGESAKRDYKREDPKERTPLAVRAEIKRQIRKAFDKLILPE
jgi:hypothetical protein